MGRVTDRRPVLRIDLDGADARRADTLAVEEPLELRVDGQPLTVTMRTPGHDVELAHGLLRSEALITTRADVRTAQYCIGARTEGPDGEPRNEYNVLDVQLHERPRPLPVSAQRSLLMHGGCGLCGKSTIDAVEAVLPNAVDTESGPRLSARTVAELPKLLREQQRIFRRTGGTHAAGLTDADGIPLVVREDIGRHNAVDKVLGWALLNDRDPAQGVLVVSSRASFELVQKAAMSGVGWLVAVSAPSSLAVEAAEQLGVTLVGFVRGRSLNVYSHPHRLASCL